MELILEHLQLVIQGAPPIALTPTEMQILLLLFNHVGHVVERDKFVHALWQEQTSNVLDVFIRRIRRKLGSMGKCIVSVRGIGYSLQIT